MSKLVIARLILSGALVGVAIAETLGFSSGAVSQMLAGSLGAAAVGALKFTHVI